MCKVYSETADSCVIATHVPTGIQVEINGRKQGSNKRKAFKELEKLVIAKDAADKAAKKKKLRDDKIKDGKVIRTYSYPRQDVKDHRSGKHSDLKKFMAGKVDLEEFSKRKDLDD